MSLGEHTAPWKVLKEPARRRSSLGNEMWVRLKNWGASPVVRCGTSWAQTSPDGGGVWPGLSFVSDSLCENVRVVLTFMRSVRGRKEMIGKIIHKPKPVVIRVAKT